MKLTDKRFWIFEVMMLLCGVATVCVESLNYGISPFYLIGHLVAFPLCFCISGIAVWKIAKGNGVWRLIGYSLLFSTIAYSLFNIILYPIYGVPFDAAIYLSSVCYYALFSTFPIIFCCYAYKVITMKGVSTIKKKGMK